MKKGLVYILVFCFIQFIGAQDVPHGIKLDLNHLDFAKDSGMKTIYAAARKARVVFDGENHSMTELNSRLEFSMMKGLYENCGYRNFIVEMSANRAYYMEQYICKNDTNARSLLNSISSEKYMRFFDHLNDWMQKVPEKDRIHIYGLDVERFYDLSLQRLVDHLNTVKAKIPKNLFSTVNAAKLLAKELLKTNEEYHSDYNSSSKKSLYGDYGYGTDYVEPNEKNTHSLTDSLSKQLELYKLWLGSDFETFKTNLASLQEYFKWIKLENDAQQYFWREEYMGRKFQQILAADTTQKFFGQFGRCHVAYSKQDNDCGWYNYHSVCNKVRTSYFHGDSSKIVSIALFYRDEEEHLSAVELGNNSNMLEEVRSIKSISSKIHLLFDLYDTANQFVELKKKFRFVLFSGSDVVELPVIRKDDTSKLVVEVFGESSHAKKRRFTFNILGLSFLKHNLTKMQNHIESVNFGNTIKNPNNWYFNHSIGYQNGIIKTELMGFYSLGNDETLLDLPSGSLQYSAGGAIGSLGVSLDVRHFSFDFMADCGVYAQKIKNDPKSSDISTVNSNLVNVVSNSFVYGGHIGCDYHFSDASIGMSYQMLFQPQDDIWRYQHSQYIYQNFGKINGSLFWNISLLMKLQL
jgi:hypothetical protein